MADAVVKVDADILKKVEDFINRKENKLLYVNKKQFVDLAIYEKLQRGKKK